MVGKHNPLVLGSSPRGPTSSCHSSQTRNVHILVLLGEKSLQNAHVLSCTLRFLIDSSPKIIQNLNVLRVLGFAVI